MVAASTCARATRRPIGHRTATTKHTTSVFIYGPPRAHACEPLRMLKNLAHAESWSQSRVGFVTRAAAPAGRKDGWSDKRTAAQAVGAISENSPRSGPG